MRSRPTPAPLKGRLRLKGLHRFGIILKLKWKNEQLGFVLKNRSFTFGEGDGGWGLKC